MPASPSRPPTRLRVPPVGTREDLEVRVDADKLDVDVVVAVDVLAAEDVPTVK